MLQLWGMNSLLMRLFAGRADCIKAPLHFLPRAYTYFTKLGSPILHQKKSSFLETSRKTETYTLETPICWWPGAVREVGHRVPSRGSQCRSHCFGNPGREGR